MRDHDTPRAVVPRMKADGGGVIINISSIAGKAGFLGGAGYAASKFGVMGLSECMGLDLRPHNIRVAAVCPGSVNAPDFRREPDRPPVEAHVLTPPRGC